MAGTMLDSIWSVLYADKTTCLIQPIQMGLIEIESLVNAPRWKNSLQINCMQEDNIQQLAETSSMTTFSHFILVITMLE